MQSLVQSQTQFFESGQTRDLNWRCQQLVRLREAIKKWEPQIFAALRSDLGRPDLETYVAEIGIVTEEITYVLKNLKRWAKPQSVGVPLVLWPARAWVEFQPIGRTLIISPWNYPFQLLVSPAIGALAAGNCVIMKPSELAPATSRCVADMIRDTFPPEYVTVVEGDASVTTALLAHGWGHIFFTGGTRVGRIIMKAAADTLSPVTLELGGKSPCVVDASADLSVAARRIVWGKFLNAGQTCVAPDYVLVQEKMHDEFLLALKTELARNFPTSASYKDEYCRIVNAQQFDRLVGLLEGASVVSGGAHDRAKLFMEPTVLTDVSMASPSMAEEIFGPILPVLKFKDVDDAVQVIRQRPNPLAFYIFSSDSMAIRQFTESLSFGGGCINHTLMHLGAPDLPFGGIGTSGMGAYHGKNSFLLFSHKKSILKKAVWPDPRLLYRPYAGKLGIVRRLIG